MFPALGSRQEFVDHSSSSSRGDWYACCGARTPSAALTMTQQASKHCQGMTVVAVITITACSFMQIMHRNCTGHGGFAALAHVHNLTAVCMPFPLVLLPPAAAIAIRLVGAVFVSDPIFPRALLLVLLVTPQYRNPWGFVRIGRILEDLDSLAGTIAFSHW